VSNFDKAAMFLKHGKILQAEKIIKQLIQESPKNTSEWLKAKSMLMKLNYQSEQWAAVISDWDEISRHKDCDSSLHALFTYSKEMLIPASTGGDRYETRLNWARGYTITNSESPLIENAQKTPPKESVSLAHNQNIISPYMSWNLLRSTAWANVNKMAFRNKVDLSIFECDFSKIKERLENLINEKNGTIIYYFFDDVLSDFELILKSAYFNCDSVLINEIFKVYFNNGFPCGWKGEYPAGMICYVDNCESKFST
jgi:hypothetical protein